MAANAEVGIFGSHQIVLDEEEEEEEETDDMGENHWKEGSEDEYYNDEINDEVYGMPSRKKVYSK